MDGIEAALLKLAVVLVGACGEGDEALEQALGGGLASLFEQGAGMVGVLEVAVTLVASRVTGECLKTVDPHVRPIHHRLTERVRAHVFLCMLAYYVEWHMRRAWAPLLFAEDDPEDAAHRRASPVRPSVPSQSVERKATTKRTAHGHPVHHFRGLLKHLATLTRNTVQVQGSQHSFEQLTVPTELQRTAFELLQVKLAM